MRTGFFVLPLIGCFSSGLFRPVSWLVRCFDRLPPGLMIFGVEAVGAKKRAISPQNAFGVVLYWVKCQNVW